MPDYTKFFKKLAKEGMKQIVSGSVLSLIPPKKTIKKEQSSVAGDTPTYQFTRRSYVAPKPPKPKPSETKKSGTLQPKQEASEQKFERPDVKKIQETVEKANNDKNVIENSNDYNVDSDSGSGSSNISEDIYKDFGGG